MNPYGFYTSDGYCGAIGMGMDHGKIYYIIRIFVSEEEYLEWFKANR